MNLTVSTDFGSYISKCVNPFMVLHLTFKIKPTMLTNGLAIQCESDRNVVKAEVDLHTE